MFKRLFFISLLCFPLTAHAGPPFAVVELFTSEGCSSCPPADQLLQEITQKAAEENLSIYTLGFHVDYWNKLGWKDVFSQSTFTQRQYIYAQTFNASSVYTPQMIINGQHSFTGSDSHKAWNYIKEELNQPAEMEIGFTVKPLEKDNYQIIYVIAHVPDHAMLNIAVLEKNISSNVTKGENSARTLTHTQVVRYFSSTPLSQPSAETVLHILPEWKKENLSIIVYIQNSKDMRILGASQATQL